MPTSLMCLGYSADEISRKLLKHLQTTKQLPTVAGYLKRREDTVRRWIGRGKVGLEGETLLYAIGWLEKCRLIPALPNPTAEDIVTAISVAFARRQLLPSTVWGELEMQSSSQLFAVIRNNTMTEFLR